MENLWRNKKSWAYNRSKTSIMKKKKLNIRFYLARAYQSFSDHLTSTFHFQLLTFFFWNTLGVHTKLDLDLFLNPHKKKLSFYPNPNRLEIEKWMKKESTHFFLKNIHWKQFGKHKESWILLATKHYKIGNEKIIKGDGYCCVSLTTAQKARFGFLNERSP